MRITKVECFSTAVPLKEKSVLARSQHTQAISVNVRLHTNEGIIGHGATRTPGPGLSSESHESMRAILEHHYGPAILGMDVLETEKIFEKLKMVRTGNHLAMTALDIAIYDAIGKKLGVPINKLFGGPVRDRVELIGWIGLDEPDKMANKAAAFVRDGFRTIKIKIGSHDGKDLDRVRLTREAIGPSTALRLDANGAYNVPEAIRVINQVSVYNLQLVEDPVEDWDLRGWARLAKAVDVPLGADLVIRSPQDAYQIISMNIVDFIKIKIVKVGGFHNAIRIISIAESAGIPVIVGRGTCSNIEALAELHLAASRKIVSLAGEMVGPLKLPDDIVTHPLVVENGDGLVPTSPGLGADLDQQKINKYAA
jgi:L-alanine-DL-glutamate epimerase-like enolase superfamily enzyme